LTVLVEEIDDLRIASPGRLELAVCDGTAEVINDGDVMGILARINSIPAANRPGASGLAKGRMSGVLVIVGSFQW
jgi:hypothetical protein